MSHARSVSAVAAAGLLAGLVAAQAAAASDRIDHRLAIFVVLVGWSYIGAGLMAWHSRPQNQFGLLLAGVGFAWFASMLSNSPNSLLYTAGASVTTLFYAVLTHALLAYPGGTIPTRGARLVVIASYVVTVGGTLAILPFFKPSDFRTGSTSADNLLLVAHHPDLVRAITTVDALLSIGLAACVLVIMVQRWKAATQAARRVLAPVLATTSVALVVNAVSLAVGVVVGIGEWIFLVAAVGFLAIPWAFLLGILRTRFVRPGAVAELVVRMGSGRPERVRDGLRWALGDPALDVLYWVPARGCYVDIEGRPCELPANRACTVVERTGQRVAAIVHDPIIEEEAGLTEQAVGAAGLALDNAQLQAELRARLQELRASEQRIRAVLETLSLIAISMSADGTIIFANPFFCELMGWQRDEVLGRDWPDTFNDGNREFVRRMQVGNVRDHETSLLRTRDGRQRLIAWSTTLISDADGRIVGATSIGEDITDRTRALAELQQVAHEQAALRRVATVVAGGTAPEAVFEAVTAEVGPLLGAQSARLVRHVADEEAVQVVGNWQLEGFEVYAVGDRMPLQHSIVLRHLLSTREPFRVDSLEGFTGPVAERGRQAGARASVGAPVIVGGEMWGALIVSAAEPLAAGTEQRLLQFTELVGAALANADAREQLAASRARLVAASDNARSRLERNLHDGAQQRLVSLSLALRLVRDRVATDPEGAGRMLDAASDELAQALGDLRELARGIHPAVLADHGLRPALEMLADRSSAVVTVSAPDRRLPAGVEAALYFVTSEALANIEKHAAADAVDVRVTVAETSATAEISDNGRGGADPAAGSGLRGLADRVEALGGRLEVKSAPGAGTTVRAEVPLDVQPDPILREMAGPAPAA
ncbi:MAG: PAS domain-containing sensor histidine kinase [Gaiellales bacterium]